MVYIVCGILSSLLSGGEVQILHGRNANSIRCLCQSDGKHEHAADGMLVCYSWNASLCCSVSPHCALLHTRSSNFVCRSNVWSHCLCCAFWSLSYRYMQSVTALSQCMVKVLTVGFVCLVSWSMVRKCTVCLFAVLLTVFNLQVCSYYYK